MRTSIRARGLRVAAGAAVAAATAALSTAFGAPAAVAADGYDLELSLVSQQVGDQVYTSVTVTNLGNVKAEDVRVEANTYYQELDTASGAGWACQNANDEPADVTPNVDSYACLLGADLAPGESTAPIIVKTTSDLTKDGYFGDAVTYAAGSDVEYDNNEGYYGKYYKQKGEPAVKGTVWDDLNKNALQQANNEEAFEPGIAGVKLELHKTNAEGPKVWEGSTDADGNYEIDWIWNGEYTLVVQAPDGRKFVKPGVGTNRNIDSDVAFDDPQELTAESAVFSCKYRIPALLGAAPTQQGQFTSADALTKGEGRGDHRKKKPCANDIDAGLFTSDKNMETPAPGTTTPADEAGKGKGKAGGVLPKTGDELFPALVGASALIAGGTALAVAARRRRNADA